MEIKTISSNFLLSIIVLLFLSIDEIKGQSIEVDSIYINFKEQIDAADGFDDKVNGLIKAGRYYYNKDNAKSEQFYIQAAELLEGRNNISEASSLSRLGLLSRQKADFDKSYQYMSKAKKIYESLNDTVGISATYLNIGSIHRYLKNKEKEIESYRKGLNLVKNSNDTLRGRSFISIASYYTRANQIDSSLYYYNKALKIFEKLNVEERIYQLYNNMAYSYTKTNEFQKSIAIRKDVLEFAKKSNNKMLMSVNYHNIASAHQKLRRNDIALLYIDSAINIAKKEGFKYRLAISYKTKAAIKAKQKRFEEAFINFQTHKKYSDSIFDRDTKSKIRELELSKNFELERQALKLIAQKKAAQNRLYLILFSTVLFFSLLLAFLARKNYKIRTRAIQEKLEKQKLQKEILAEKFKTSEREVKQLIADNSMRLEFLRQLSDQIKSEKRESENPGVKRYINNLVLKLQQQIVTEGKLTSLQEKTNAINKDFYNSLGKKFPELTKTEKEVCALLRLNLSIKEIASIRNVSSDSIKTVRYRIRKKMNAPKDHELEYFIQNIEF